MSAFKQFLAPQIALCQPALRHATSRIVGGMATPTAWKTLPQVPRHSLLMASALPRSSIVISCSTLKFRKGLHQNNLSIPAIQKTGVHLAPALDIDGATLFKHERFIQPLPGGVRYMDSSGDAVGFHSTGSAYNVSPQVTLDSEDLHRVWNLHGPTLRRAAPVQDPCPRRQGIRRL